MNDLTWRTVLLVTGVLAVLLSITGPGLRDTAPVLPTLELGGVADSRL